MTITPKHLALPLGALAAAAALTVPAPAASAADAPLQREAKKYDRLHAAVERDGGRAGRDIVDEGVRRHGDVRSATAREVAGSIRRLRAMRAPAATATAASGATASAPAGSGLDSVAACESGGDPGAVSANGQYRGKYQFDQRTWESVGGSGDPAAASESTQDALAARLQAQRGSSPWPVCG